ncbi:hypothetical protein PC128_g26405 [Phytophthora cactorum]|nr:hypothetical protein PC128_g26405 [Phytophthora cactorum]
MTCNNCLQRGHIALKYGSPQQQNNGTYKRGQQANSTEAEPDYVRRITVVNA